MIDGNTDDEQDFTDPGFVLGAVLAQIEDLNRADAWEVLKRALDVAYHRSETASDLADLEERLESGAITYPAGAEVVVQFPCEVYVHVDLNTGLPTKTIVQTPNVATMHEVDVCCQRYGPDVDARWGRSATEDEKLVALQSLDDNGWPAPELVA